jgi:hypothetical protein
MIAIDDIISIIVFGTLATCIIINAITGGGVSPVIADISKTIIGFIFGKKYGQVRSK